jgi:hypothetical protein
MFKNIPQTRLLCYIMLLGLLPLVFVGASILSQLSGINETQSSLYTLQERVFIREKKQAVNRAVRNTFSDADHFYIDKYLETQTFLEPEIENLQKIVSNKNYPEDETVRKRLEHLSGQGNAMIFTEGVVQTYPLFQETTETLVHPVEINSSDLQEILALIEGVEIGNYKPAPNRPQLLILDFKLDKKNLNDKNDVFMLNLKLLKREFL